MTPNPYQVYADLQSPRFVRFRSPCVVRFLTVQVSFHSDVLDRLFPVICEKSPVHSMKFYKLISDYVKTGFFFGENFFCARFLGQHFFALSEDSILNMNISMAAES